MQIGPLVALDKTVNLTVPVVLISGAKVINVHTHAKIPVQ